jgi:hypothetical protein
MSGKLAQKQALLSFSLLEKKNTGDGTAMVEPTIPKSFQNDTK